MDNLNPTMVQALSYVLLHQLQELELHVTRPSRDFPELSEDELKYKIQLTKKISWGVWKLSQGNMTTPGQWEVFWSQILTT